MATRRCQISLNRLIELHDFAKENAAKFPRRRFLYSELTQLGGRNFIGIIGPRGVGKSVLLRQYALEHPEAFYLSADTLEADDDPWEVLTNLKKHYGFTTILLDEVHYLDNANAFLKQLYDFNEVRVWFSSSVALAMHESAHDLSRRVRLRTLRPFSFREYLAFAYDEELPPLTLAQILDRQWSAAHLRAGHRFRAYLRGGLLPYAVQDPEPFELLRNILEKIVTRDLPSVARLRVDELNLIRLLLRFVGRSSVDGINYSSLSRNLGITKYKAAQYVELLTNAFVLRPVDPAGTNVIREPKVLMVPPIRLLYRGYDEAVGGLREDFAVEALGLANYDLLYLKSARGSKTPDFLLSDESEGLALEIGGRGKGRSQFKGVEVEKKVIFAHTDLPDDKRLPLFLLGYLARRTEPGG